jgi:hypothetical protein
MSMLSAFNTQLVNFFEELVGTFPEEKDIRMGLEAIQGAKKINPRLILDLFYEHVYKDLAEPINRRDIELVQRVAHQKIATQFNEIMPALAIFDRLWTKMTPSNQEVVWKYMKVLCILCEKSRAAG